MVISVITLPIAHPVPGAHDVMVCTLVEMIISMTVEAPGVTEGPNKVVVGYGAVVLKLYPRVELVEIVG